MSITSNDTQARTPSPRPGPSPLRYRDAVGAVLLLEMRQRLRSRGWYVMLAVWFGVIALVTALAGYAAGFEDGVGQVMFELVVGFVLFFGLLVAPALSANSITGDRSAGTLAILQNTLLTPGQLLWGKWLAAWLASLGFLVVSLPMIAWAMSYGDVYLPAVPVFVLMTAVELGIACAIGVGVSARSSRPLFAIVASYLLVAMLGLGTLIAYGLSLQLVREEARASEQVWPGDPWPAVEYDANGQILDDQGQVVEDQDAAYRELDALSAAAQSDPNAFVCSSFSYDVSIFHTERITWLLAANPFVVVADAVPMRAPTPDTNALMGAGPMGAISEGVRASQAGGMDQQPCLNGEKQVLTTPEVAPVWPLGLAIQSALAAGLVVAGRRRLVTPAGRLPTGTRVA